MNTFQRLRVTPLAQYGLALLLLAGVAGLAVAGYYGTYYQANYCHSYFTPKDVFVFQPPLVVPVQPSRAVSPRPAAQPADVIDGELPRVLPRRRAAAKPAIDMAKVGSDLHACIACHRSPSAKGGVTLFDKQSNFDPRVSLREIYEAVESGSMPPDPRPKLDEATKERLRIAAGAPEKGQ
jgi:hypothetical protein